MLTSLHSPARPLQNMDSFNLLETPSKSLVEESSSLMLFSPPTVTTANLGDSLGYGSYQSSCDTTNDSHERSGSALGVHPLSAIDRTPNSTNQRRVSIVFRYSNSYLNIFSMAEIWANRLIDWFTYYLIWFDYHLFIVWLLPAFSALIVPLLVLGKSFKCLKVSPITTITTITIIIIILAVSPIHYRIWHIFGTAFAQNLLSFCCFIVLFGFRFEFWHKSEHSLKSLTIEHWFLSVCKD